MIYTFNPPTNDRLTIELNPQGELRVKFSGSRVIEGIFGAPAIEQAKSGLVSAKAVLERAVKKLEEENAERSRRAAENGKESADRATSQDVDAAKHNVEVAEQQLEGALFLAKVAALLKPRAHEHAAKPVEAKPAKAGQASAS